MKKTISFIMIAALIFTLSACGTNDNNKKTILDISEMLDIEMSQECVIGMQNDDNGFISLEITETNTVDEIKSEWKELPLTENLTALVYGLEDETSSIGPYISEDGEALFPKVENGYYYFYDRHSDSNDHFDDTNVLARHSFNFVIAIFDTDTNRLYYSKFDT